MYTTSVELEEISNTRILLTNSIDQSCIWFKECQSVRPIVQVMFIMCWKANR